MDIRFCDICNESVPQSDLELGRAFLRKGRVVCATCEAAMSHPDEGGWGEELELQGGAPTPGAHPAGVHEVPRPPAYAGGFPFDPYAAHPAPQPRPRGGGGALLAGLIGAFALAAATVSTLVLTDRLEGLRNEERAEGRRLEAELSRQTERLEAQLERVRIEDRELLRGEIARGEADGDRARGELAARLGELAARVEALAGMARRMDELSLQVEGERRERAALESSLAQVQRDVHVLAERWMEALAAGDVVQERAAAPPVRAEPAWAEHVPGLDSPNAATRWSAVTALGQTKDPAVVPHLVGMLTDPDIFVRTATARILGDLGSEEGVPALLDALEDPELSVREASNVALQRITGQDFKFAADAPEAERARRVKAWRDWWKKKNERA